MNTIKVIAFFILVFAPHLSLVSQEKTRTWTSKAGTKIEAQAFSLKQQKLGLRTDAGRELWVPLNQLSSVDIQYLQEKFAGHPDLPPLPGIPQGSGKAKTDFTGLALGKIHGPIKASQHSSYFVYLPKSLKQGQSAAYFLLTMAGGGKSKVLQPYLPGAERCGVIVAVSVQSANNNTGKPHSNFQHSMNCVNHINETLPVDSNRVFFGGISGGGATSMGNSIAYKGALGAIPIIGYTPFSMIPDSKKQKRFYYILGGGEDYNRYSSALIQSHHKGRAIHRIYAGGHSQAPDSYLSDAICWLMGRHLSDDDSRSLNPERLDYEAAMIRWINRLKEKAPHQAFYWCHFLTDTYGIRGHNSSVIKEIKASLAGTPKNTQYAAGIDAISAFSLKYFCSYHNGSIGNYNKGPSGPAASKMAKEYSAVPEIAKIFTSMSKPTVQIGGGKKKKK